MFIRLLIISILLNVVIQSAVTNSSKGQITADALTLPKQPQQASLYDDYDLNDHQTLGNHIEGSGGGAASLDEYADDDEEEQLSKVTATKISMSTSTSTTLTTTTKPRISSSSSTTTTTTSIKWMKSTANYNHPKKRNESSTTSVFNDLDASEFKDDHEEYADDLEDDAYYNEPTVLNKISLTSYSSAGYPMASTRHTLPANRTTPIWVLFSFLTRPPIAAGILAGLAIGILTSIILLICIIRRYHKREKSHSSYTTGLLYPNQYGYSKSPQEFYA